MSDLIKRLRFWGENLESATTQPNEDMHEAADLIEQQQRRIDQLNDSVTIWKNTSEDLVKYRDKLKQERDALAAHVEGLKSDLLSLSANNVRLTSSLGNMAYAVEHDLHPCVEQLSDEDIAELEEAKKLLSESPKTSLAEVIAEAKARQAEESYADALCDVPNLLDSEYGLGDIAAMCHLLAEEHANKIRNKDGE